MPNESDMTAGIAQEVLEMRYGIVKVAEVFINYSPSFVSKIFSVIGFLPISIEGNERNGTRDYYGYCSQFSALETGVAVPVYSLTFNVNQVSGVAEVSVVPVPKEETKQRRLL